MSARVPQGTPPSSRPLLRLGSRPRKDTGWVSYWIHFEGETADRLREAGTVQPQRAVLRVGVDETILRAFTTVLDVLPSESAGFSQIAPAAAQRPRSSG